MYAFGPVSQRLGRNQDGFDASTGWNDRSAPSTGNFDDF
jgi:hypothetical protein